MLTQDHLKSRLSYDPATGVFVWLNGQCIGKVAGCLNTDGYLVIRINKKNHYGHQLAFLYMTGSIPDLIDHENQNTSDNRWDNLRVADKSKNSINSNKRKLSNTGYRGVVKTACGRWCSRITFQGQTIRLGNFVKIEDAANAYIVKRQELFGEFTPND